MAIIKLPNEGDTHTMRVTGCEAVQGQYGEQVKFTGDGGDILFLPKDSADRQLARIPLEYITAVGETLTFSRDPNPKKGAKPFWSIAVANPRATQPSKRVSPKDADPQKGLPPSFGGPIKGLDDGPEPYRDDDARFEAFSAAVDSLDPAAQPKLTPREEREEREQAEAVTPAKRFLAFYVDTYAEMLAGLSAVHSAAVSANVGPRSRAPEAIPALTSDTVQAAVATYVIQCEKRGWLAR